VARQVDVIMSFLPDDGAVWEVYFGPDRILANAPAGVRILEMSTVLRETAREL